jgi:hypothetical protein
VERSKAFETKAQAIRYASSMETDRDRGDYLDPNAGKTKLDDIGPRWLASRPVDPASEIQYESKWRIHVRPAFGNRMVKSIRPSEIAVWLTELTSTYEHSTARSAFLVLNGCLELAVADELIKRNPASSKVVKKPGEPARASLSGPTRPLNASSRRTQTSSSSFRSPDPRRASSGRDLRTVT